MTMSFLLRGGDCESSSDIFRNVCIFSAMAAMIGSRRRVSLFSVTRWTPHRLGYGNSVTQVGLPSCHSRNDLQS